MNKNQVGSAYVAVIAAVVLVAAVSFVAFRVAGGSNDSKKSSSSSQTQFNQTINKVPDQAEADIQLQNFGVSPEDILYSTQATREFKDKGLKGFYVFGDMLPGNRQNPNFEFAAMKEGAKIVAAIDGKVTFIREQPESNDSEVFIQPKDGSQWTVGYDHLVNVSVKRGDSVKAGDVLGQPARENNGMLRFEIQINKDANGQTTHICPSTLFAPAVKDKLIADLTTMQDKWEQTTGFELYNPGTQKPVGCIKTTLTPTEAEGR